MLTKRYAMKRRLTAALGQEGGRDARDVETRQRLERE